MTHRNKTYINFQEAVVHICVYLGDDDANKYNAKVTRFLKAAIQEMNLFLFPSINVEKLIVKDNLTANLPDDYVSMSRIGVCCSNGELMPLGHNNKLCVIPREPFKLDCCECNKVVDSKGVIDRGKSECCNVCSISTPHYFGSNSFMYGYRYLYGDSAGKETQGTYKIDLLNGRIIFGSGYNVKVGAEIMIEYSSSLTSEEFLQIPSISLIYLQHRVASMLKPGIGERQQETKTYRMQYRLLKRALSKLTLDDFTNAVRKGYKSSPKR